MLNVPISSPHEIIRLHPHTGYLTLKGSLVDPRLRASNEHILIVRVPRAGGRPDCPSHSFQGTGSIEDSPLNWQVAEQLLAGHLSLSLSLRESRFTKKKAATSTIPKTCNEVVQSGLRIEAGS
jgi:hypothetical protein